MNAFYSTLLIVLTTTGLQPSFVRLFSGHEYHVAAGDHGSRTFNYRLFEPPVSGSGERYPLIVWLHGYGERGGDNVHHLRWLDSLIFMDTADCSQYPFYLLAVQCPRDDPYWYREPGSEPGSGDMIDATFAIVQDLLKKHPIDRDRLYLAGLSSGGNGCWEFATRYPDLFAAVAPMAAGTSETVNLERIVSVPVWVFHGSHDATAPADGARRMVTRLLELGGNACLTEIPTTSHDCWTAAFRDYRLLDWLLAQHRRESSNSYPPGTVPLLARLEDAVADWKWWQLLLQAGVVLLPVTLGVFAFAKRAQRARSVEPAELIERGTTVLADGSAGPPGVGPSADAVH